MISLARICKHVSAFSACTIASCAAVSLAPMATQAQGQHVDSVTAVRLAELGEVWNAVKYFHPYLAYRNIDWDAAGARAVTALSAAHTANERSAAIEHMLEALGDPVTRVISADNGVGNVESVLRPGGIAASTTTSDSILVVNMTDFQELSDFSTLPAKVRGLSGRLENARGVVIDLRTNGGGPEIAKLVDWVLANTRFTTHLVSSAIAAPGQRERHYNGLVPRVGGTSGGYTSGFYVTDGERFTPAPDRVGEAPMPMAFIIRRGSPVPAVALALQVAGRGYIIAEKGATEESVVETTTIPVLDSIVVQLRVSELVYADGRAGLRFDSVTAPATKTNDPAMNAALALVRDRHHMSSELTSVPAFGTPQLDSTYDAMTYPSPSYRILAAYRIWGIIQYFYPYRNLIGEDWNGVLTSFIPKLAAATDSLDYALTVAEMVTHIHDSHAFMYSPTLMAHFGRAGPPIRVRMIEGVPVVTDLLVDSLARAAGISLGDVLLTVDGENVNVRIARMRKHLAGSTPQAVNSIVMGKLLNGTDSTVVTLGVRDAKGRTKTVRLTRGTPWLFIPQRRAKPMLRWLPGHIGYADLDRLPVGAVDSMFTMFRDARGIVFDMRGYPQGTAWAIMPRLTVHPGIPAAIFRQRLTMSPDTVAHASVEVVMRTTSAGPPYRGRTVMLIDERAVSQAEHTGLMLKAANGTLFVGSPTQGANGDVTNFVVPGGIVISMSGIAVLHGDGSQLQRVGLIPDVEVRSTIAGIRAGRDEVLERAVSILQKGAPASSGH